MRLSRLVKNLKESPTLAVSSRAKELRDQGRTIINLSVGEPDFSTPEPICHAANEALKAGKTRYTAVPGIIELRKKICEDLLKRKGLSYEPSQIVVTTGAKQALYNAILSLVGPGDEVIIPRPYWVSYPTQVEMAGGTVVSIETRLEDNFQIDVDEIAKAITPYTKMIIVTSPNNPTGAVYERERMQALADLLEKHPDVWLLCDDIYDQLVYGGVKAINPLQLNPALKDRTVVINGFAKAYAMTGWRIGYLAAPEAVVKAVIAIQGACTSGTNAPTQYAALRALDEDISLQIEEMRGIFSKRLEVMLESFGQIPDIVCPRPQGAFYLMADFSGWLGSTKHNGELIKNTVDLATYILEEAGVAAVAGEGFDAPGQMRFSYAAGEEDIKEAARLIKEALGKLKRGE